MGFWFRDLSLGSAVAGSPRYQGILVTDRAIGKRSGAEICLDCGARTIRFELRPLELGPVVDGLRVIRKGLTGNESVIINGLVNGRDQVSKVNPQPGDMNQFTASQLELQKNVVVESFGNGEREASWKPATTGTVAQAGQPIG